MVIEVPYTRLSDLCAPQLLSPTKVQSYQLVCQHEPPQRPDWYLN